MRCVSCGQPVPEGVELCATCTTERIPAATLASLAADVMGDAPVELRPRFIGREAQLQTLVEAWERARGGEGGFVAIIGDPGTGKTRLMGELVRRAGERCFVASAAGSLPYVGFVRLLRARFGIGAGDDIDAARAKIAAGVAAVLPGRAEVAELIAQLCQVAEPLSDQHVEARTFIALKRFFGADAAGGPMVLVLDDLDQAGAETVNLVHYLAAGLAAAPVLLLCAGRPALYDGHPAFGDGEASLTRIDLGPLSPADAEALLGAILGGGDVPARLSLHVRALAQSPLHLFELTRFLVEARAVVPADGTWRIDDARLGAIPLPGDVTAERLALMPAGERDILEKASVCGETFWLDAVVALLRAPSQTDPDGPPLGDIATAGDRTRAEVSQVLGRLAGREWVVRLGESSIPGETEYRFAYPHLWEAVAGGVDERARRAWHRVVAQWLELRPEGRQEEEQEEIGRHLEQAGDRDAAAACYRRAGDAARARFMNEKAIRLYARALACLREGSLAARIHLWHDLGSVFELKGDFEEALGAFERMLRLTWVVSSRSKAAVALSKMGRVWRKKGDLRLALEYLGRAHDLFEKASDQRGFAGALDDIGQVLYLAGRYDEAEAKIRQALRLREQAGEKRSIAQSLSTLGSLAKDRGRLSEAEACHRNALELRREARDRAGAITSQHHLASISLEKGDLAAARRGWEEALADAERIGALPLQALVLAKLGEVALSQGKTEEARRRLEEASTLARELDDRRLLSESARSLGLLELELGNAPRARELCAKALEIAEMAGLRDQVGRALLALGEVHAATLFDEAKGDAGLAEDYFRRGVEIFRQLGNHTELARGLERFGRHKLERGDTPGGRGLLEEAQSLFAKLGVKAEVGKVIREIEGAP
ncbi:MAG TPA: tetratricopeptide repeat protein [Haliangiales bacterium]|nr:tetratricopeptide repeat protein [Haliangiales bacterium]